MREDTRTKKALARLVRHPSITLKALAAELGTSYDAVHSWTQVDGPVPTLAQVRALVWAAARLDRVAARDLAADLFGLGDAGWVLSSAPEPSPSSTDVVREVMEAGEAMGALHGATLRAVADGVVTVPEAQVVDQRAERVMRECVDIRERMGRVISLRLPLSAGVGA